MKRCTRCGATKGLRDFPPKKNRPHCVDSWCRACHRDSDRARRKQPKVQAADRARCRGDAYRAQKQQSRRRRRATVIGRTQEAARQAVRTAINRGDIDRPECCSRCGQRGPVEAHHRNGYYRPTDVVWFCRPCHAVEHRIKEASDA